MNNLLTLSAPVDELSSLPQELLVGCIFIKIDIVSMFALSFTSKVYHNLLKSTKLISVKQYFACAIQFGFINITNWLRLTWTNTIDIEGKVSYRGLEDDYYYTTHASACGQLAMLKHLTELGYHWECETYTKAAKNGHLDILNWMFDNRRDSFLSDHFIDPSIAKAAASGGQNIVLQWIKEKGGKYCGRRIFTKAVKKGHLETMQWLIDDGYTWKSDLKGLLLFLKATKTGNLKTMQWLKSHGAPMKHETVFVEAAKTGRIKVMRWLKANGVPWNENTVAAACRNEHYDAAKWLVQNGCPWLGPNAHPMDKFPHYDEFIRFYNS
jgi:hypothetical protein